MNAEQPRSLFRQGRQNERRVDALALRAEEGRGMAAKSVGESRAGSDPTISEWGNPTDCGQSPRERRAPGELKHLTYPEEKRVFP